MRIRNNGDEFNLWDPPIPIGLGNGTIIQVVTPPLHRSHTSGPFIVPPHCSLKFSFRIPYRSLSVVAFGGEHPPDGTEYELNDASTLSVPAGSRCFVIDIGHLSEPTQVTARMDLVPVTDEVILDDSLILFDEPMRMSACANKYMLDMGLFTLRVGRRHNDLSWKNGWTAAIYMRNTNHVIDREHIGLETKEAARDFLTKYVRKIAEQQLKFTSGK